MSTVKININYLVPPALDWVVCVCEKTQMGAYTRYSTDWAHGGPIIEREKISLEFLPGAGDTGADVWVATRIERPAVSEEQGPTALIAAMRCYVASKLGEIVEVPRELYKEDV